jgi:hypothetical protein
MAVVARLRCNLYIRHFYHRLVQAGKPAKVAIVASGGMGEVYGPWLSLWGEEFWR